MPRIRRHLVLFALAGAFAPAAAASDIDYGSADAWLARPGLDSVVGLVPAGSGYSDMQATARADVSTRTRPPA